MYNLKQINCKLVDLTSEEQAAISSYESVMAAVYTRLHGTQTTQAFI